MGILKRYKYLGAYVQDSGEVEREVTCKMQAGWLKWREASGLLCDRSVPLKLKGKYYNGLTTTQGRGCETNYAVLCGVLDFEEEPRTEGEGDRNENAKNDVRSDEEGQSKK